MALSIYLFRFFLLLSFCLSVKILLLAGDRLTGQQQADTMSKVRGGEHWVYNQANMYMLDLTAPEVGLMAHFMNSGQTLHKAPIDDLKKLRPEMLTFEQFLIKNGYDKKELPHPSTCVIA